jgi:peptidoglycan/xylan/chitin deacetylase (PgdA/CDA1 family)
MKLANGETVTVTTLLYHSFSSISTRQFEELTIDPQLFFDQLNALQEIGCRFVLFREIPKLLEGGTSPAGDPSAPLIAVTIDDGLSDVISGAFPSLDKLGVPATLFVPTAFVGKGANWLRGPDQGRPMCDWSSLCDLQQSGWEIGSHGHNHLAADISDRTVVSQDAALSRRLLEDRLGTAVTSFAYPFGYHSRQSRALLEAAGFEQAAIVAELQARTGDDRLALPRVQVNSHHTPQALVEKVSRVGRGGRWKNQSKQHVWRFCRRSFGWGPPEAAARATYEVPVLTEGAIDG